MVQLQESGHYDDAVRVVEGWISQHQNDTSQNDFLHLQIAMVTGFDGFVINGSEVLQHSLAVLDLVAYFPLCLVNADCGEVIFQGRGVPQFLMPAESVHLSAKATNQELARLSINLYYPSRGERVA